MVLFFSSLRAVAVARVSCRSCGFHLLSAFLRLAVPVACCSLVLCVCVLLVSELLEDSWLLAVACCACGIWVLCVLSFVVFVYRTVIVASSLVPAFRSVSSAPECLCLSELAAVLCAWASLHSLLCARFYARAPICARL